MKIDCKACGRKREKKYLTPIGKVRRIHLCREGYIAYYGCKPEEWERLNNVFKPKHFK